MRTDYLPSTQEIQDAVTDEIAALGGRITDVIDTGDSLFVRSVLEARASIRPGDEIQGGVAVRVVAGAIDVHPYTLRQVCTNGAVIVQAMPSRQLERSSTEGFGAWYDAAVTLSNLGEAVRACAAPEVFAMNADEMRALMDVSASMALQYLLWAARLPEHAKTRLIPELFRERFGDNDDRSAFGVMNAVTARARGMRDPAVRWTLECLGGALPGVLKQRAAYGTAAESDTPATARSRGARTAADHA